MFLICCVRVTNSYIHTEFEAVPHSNLVVTADTCANDVSTCPDFIIANIGQISVLDCQRQFKGGKNK